MSAVTLTLSREDLGSRILESNQAVHQVEKDAKGVVDVRGVVWLRSEGAPTIPKTRLLADQTRRAPIFKRTKPQPPKEGSFATLLIPRPSSATTCEHKRNEASNTIMADISRQSSPRIASTLISSSPSRPSPLSRPHWPYTTYTHRPSSSASSSNSLNSSINSTSSTGVQGWDYRSAGSGAGTPSPSGIVRRPSSASLQNGVAIIEDGMRHWSFAV